MTDIIDTVQVQSVADSLINLFEITLKGQTTPLVYATSGLDENSKNIYFPTTDGTSLEEYIAMPIGISEITLSADGPQNRPTLTMGNLITLGRTLVSNADGDSDETTWSKILEANNIVKPEDMIGSTVIHRRTLLKKTYRETDVAGWTTTLPNEFPSMKYIIDRLSTETAMAVAYELASPFDLEGVKVPGRVVVGKYCPWKYQGIAIDGINGGSGCSWGFTTGQGSFYDINDNLITNNISSIPTYSAASSYSVGNKVKTLTTVGSDSWVRIYECLKAVSVAADYPPETSRSYWTRIDVCGKLISSCKVRFHGTDGTGESSGSSIRPLPFGGFPGTRKFR